MSLATPERSRLSPAARPRRHQWLKPGWPLAALYVGFPVWWALGFAQVIFFVMAAAMGVYVLRCRPLRTPPGFGLWLLFLVWMAAGVFVLWAQAPDTAGGGGLARLVNFGIRAMWYVVATLAMLYILNTAREFSTLRVVRLLGLMFVVTAAFGLAASIAPSFEFKSLAELLLPGRLGSSRFVTTLVHPSLASSSDFLGYDQPRPTAPFPYSNAWGNNLALYLPFFIYGWFGPSAGWRRWVAPPILVAAVVPITFSLNRGLWISVAAAATYAAVRLAMNGRVRALQVLLVSTVVLGAVFVLSPLYDTVQLRIATPHSNERRASVAEEVIRVTATGSPVVGYGTTRQMLGSFASLAGGGTPQCRQCAPPPLGTQGFMWRLILTTGFVGTVLSLSFLGLQFLRRARGPAPLDVVCCTALLIGFICFFVYDSLGSALVTIMIAIGLMARGDEQEAEPGAPT